MHMCIHIYISLSLCIYIITYVSLYLYLSMYTYIHMIWISVEGVEPNRFSSVGDGFALDTK